MFVRISPSMLNLSFYFVNTFIILQPLILEQ